jgi:transcriptional regulator with XRE-family HTH domain
MSANIRALRESLGWSQTDLADRAGVSRQMIGAIEANRHTPNVGAALALARALGTSVEELFCEAPAASPAIAVAAVDDDPRGSSVAIGRVGDTLVSVPARHGIAGSEHWAMADATVGADGTVSMLTDGTTDGLVIAGCDPALGVVAALVERTSGQRVIPAHASTARSVEALGSGRVHAAVVHAPAGRLPTPPVPVRRWHLARWQVGLASGRSRGVPTLEEIAERGLRVVQRDRGAGTQLAFARALDRIGAHSGVPGPVGDGHVDVARRVATGAAAGITMEAAARSFGLGFSALEEHTVEVWIDERWAALASATALVDVLTGASLRSRLELIGGYDLGSCGQGVM